MERTMLRGGVCSVCEGERGMADRPLDDCLWGSGTVRRTPSLPGLMRGLRKGGKWGEVREGVRGGS